MEEILIVSLGWGFAAILLAGGIGLILFVARRRWYVQAVFALVILGSLLVTGIGLGFLSGPADEKATGTVLIAIGLFMLLATGIAIKVLYFAPHLSLRQHELATSRHEALPPGSVSDHIMAKHQL